MDPISINVKIWRWPGDIGWHFVSLPKEYYKIIRDKNPKGMIHVKVTCDEYSWNTALFPHSKTKSFILPIKQSVRNKLNLWDGDRVLLRIQQL